MSSSHHIHPIGHLLLPRADRERFLRQRSKVLWMTGLSGSGKSTIAQSLEKRLFSLGFFCKVLDGDNVRHGINNNLGFSDADRTENIRRIAEVARLFCQAGVVTLCSFISPTRAIREQARRIIGPADFLEVFVDAPLALCETRDVKGLYAKARRGEIPAFTGIDAPYEPPRTPDICVRTGEQSLDASVDTILEQLLPFIRLDGPAGGDNPAGD
ncbi:MAG: adenylyl-sulfate kinase [Bacteroidota bacterium]